MKYVRIEGGKKLATFIKPMLAQLSDDPAFDSPDWIFEIKWDGYRAVAEIQKDKVKFYSRNGLTFEAAYPKVYEELQKIAIDAVLDGEVVVMDEHGLPNFQKLQNYERNKKLPIHYYVFDCLSYKGKDITHLPLLERKAIVKKLLPVSPVLKYCDHVEEEGKQFFEHAKKANLEGIIAKRATSIYVIGKRTKDWLKIKNVNSDEAVIVGFTDPKGSRKYFGSLLLATYKNKKLTYIGNVGTGFTEKTLSMLHGKLKPLIQKESPLDVPIKQPPDVTWVKPKLVANIKFTEITEDGSVRHPVFMGLRIDKSAEEVVPEKKVSAKIKSERSGRVKKK